MIQASRIPSEFNDFLFATIGEQENETPLSVLSALMRVDVDPWQEAARLAQLPKEQAIQGLSSMIGDVPSAGWTESESNMISARLVELLPSRKNFDFWADDISFRIVFSLAVIGVMSATVLGVIVAESDVPSSTTRHAVMRVPDGAAPQLPPSPSMRGLR